MERIEMVEKLREKAGIGYEEARQALEGSGWDLLQALVNLERQGKMRKGNGKMEQGKAQAGAESLAARFVNWLKSLVEISNSNQFAVMREGRRVLTVPVLVAVLLLLVLNGFFVLALIVALVMGYRFHYLPAKELQKEKQDLEEAERAAEDILNHHTVNSFGEGA